MQVFQELSPGEGADLHGAALFKVGALPEVQDEPEQGKLKAANGKCRKRYCPLERLEALEIRHAILFVPPL